MEGYTADPGVVSPPVDWKAVAGRLVARRGPAARAAAEELVREAYRMHGERVPPIVWCDTPVHLGVAMGALRAYWAGDSAELFQRPWCERAREELSVMPYTTSSWRDYVATRAERVADSWWPTCPGLGKVHHPDVPVPQRLAEELAAAGLTIPAGATVPDWLVDGPEVDMGWLNQFWFLPVVLAQVCPYPVPEGLRAVLEHPLVALNAMVSMACLTGACCLLVPPPEILELDGDGRLHNLDGPVMRWKSGDDEIPDQEVFAVLGVAMDGEVFWSPSPLHICWLGEAGLALLRRRGLDEFLSMLGGWSVGAGRAGETAWRVRVGPVIFDFAPVVTEVASPEGTVVSVAFSQKGPLAIQRIGPDGTREPAVVAHQYGTDKLKMVE